MLDISNDKIKMDVKPKIVLKINTKSIQPNNIPVWDGKRCGLGIYLGGGGYYVCPHNNL